MLFNFGQKSSFHFFSPEELCPCVPSFFLIFIFFILECLVNSALHAQDLYHEDMRSFDHLSILSVSLLFLGHLLWHSNWISCLILDLWSKNYFLIDPPNSTFIGPVFFFSYGQWSFDFMVTCVKSFLNIPSQVCRDSDVI